MRGHSPVFVELDGHRTWLKWHRARRRADDPVFTRRRIVEGMRLGASIEIDLVIHADRGFAVLHDRRVDDATTGVGNVAALSATTLRSLFLRAGDGAVLDQPVLLLEDLADVLSGIDVDPNALLQLDFKETGADLDSTAIDTFAAAVTPFASNAILSCGDATAVRLLTEPVPALRIGYDPCHNGASDAVLVSGDYDSFVSTAISASPNAEMVYIERRLIIDADRRGVDLVGEFHAGGRTVDAYTVYRTDGPSVDEVRRLVELRVDQITTDDPEGLASALLGPEVPHAD